MSQLERFGGREGEAAYSAWHRVPSLSRFMSHENARRIANINLDKSFWIETHDVTYVPFAIVETAQDINQVSKPTTMLRNLAMPAARPAFLVLYTLCDDIDDITGYREIVRFRVKKVYPTMTEFKAGTPQQYADWLVRVHDFGFRIIAEHARHGVGMPRNHDVARMVKVIENRIQGAEAQLELF